LLCDKQIDDSKKDNINRDEINIEKCDRLLSKDSLTSHSSSNTVVPSSRDACALRTTREEVSSRSGGGRGDGGAADCVGGGGENWNDAQRDSCSGGSGGSGSSSVQYTSKHRTDDPEGQYRIQIYAYI